MPAVGGLDELSDRQGIEELVGDDDQWIVADGVDVVGPVRVVLAEALGLLGPQRRVGFEQLQMDGIEEAVGLGGDAQRVLHQGAAAGAEFEQGEAPGLIQLLPEVDDEEADEFAEHLADLGGGDEIALGAQRVGAGVVAGAWVGEGEAHIGGERHRAGLAQLHVDDISQGAGISHGRASGRR